MACLAQQQYYSYNGYELPQNTMNCKIRVAKRILNTNFSSSNFFDLIDNDKLIAIDVNEMNEILDSGCFNIPEKDYIRELRRKTMNRKTAKMSRIRDKHEYQELNGEVEILRATRKMLSQEKEDLIQEINFYKKLMDNH